MEYVSYVCVCIHVCACVCVNVCMFMCVRYLRRAEEGFGSAGAGVSGATELANMDTGTRTLVLRQ